MYLVASCLVVCTLTCHGLHILELWAKANLLFCMLLLSGILGMVKLKYTHKNHKGLSNISSAILWGCVEMVPQGNSVLIVCVLWSCLPYKDTRSWKTLSSTLPWRTKLTSLCIPLCTCATFSVSLHLVMGADCLKLNSLCIPHYTCAMFSVSSSGVGCRLFEVLTSSKWPRSSCSHKAHTHKQSLCAALIFLLGKQTHSLTLCSLGILFKN